jgi:heme oxygenase (mycobilin-producing)
MSVTLINLFTVPAEEEAGFLERFKATAERLKDLPGFGGTNLHRNIGVGDQAYRFVNVAIWESAEAWQAALPQIMQGGGMGGGVIPKAALYDSIFRFPDKG